MTSKLFRKKLSMAQQEEITGYIFITPFIIGFIIFYGLPFIIAFVLSFTNLHFSTNIANAKFIGFQNFVNILKDKTALQSLARSGFYTAIYVPLIMSTSLILAYLLNKKIFARNTIRTMIFMPYVSNLVAISIVWSILLDYKDGPINMALKAIGMSNPPMWLVGNTTVVIPTIAIIVCWQGMGFNVVTFLAALQGVPRELYESAEIDGAGSVRKFFHITMPMISPTTFFLLITSLLVSFQNFGIIRVLTKGGPGNASWVLPINIVEEAFSYNKIAYATSQALILFIIIVSITIFQWKYQKKWVNY